MSPDVLTQLRTYATQLDDEAPSLEQLMPQIMPTPLPLRVPHRRRWVLAGAVVLVVIGVLTLGMLLGGGEESPVVTDPSTTTTPPSTLPPSAVGDAGSSWTRVRISEAVFGPETTIFDVAFGGSGYVAVGLAGEGAAVWTSVDGAVWERVSVDPSMVSVAGMVTAAGPGFVLVGADDTGAAVWTSADGIVWTRAPVDPTVFGGASSHVLANSGSQVIVGGFKDGQLAVWHSEDGLAWEQAVVNDSQGANIRDISVGGPGFVAVGRDRTVAAVWTSADGQTWSRIATDPGVFEDVGIEAVASKGTSLIAFGQDLSFGDDGHPALLSSPDGTAWSRTDLDPDLFGQAIVEDVIAAGPGYVAVGAREGRAAMWTSQDGLVWELAELDPIQNDRAMVMSIAAGPGRLIAVGQQQVSPQNSVGAMWVSLPVAEEELIPPPSTTPTAVAPDVSELTWRRADIDPTVILDGRLYDVASGEAGLVALGFRREPDGTTSRLVMTSADGSSWDLMSVLDQEPRLVAIVTGGPGLVAAGSIEGGDDCYGSDAAFSYSEDGVSWNRVPHDPNAFADAEVFKVITGGPGLVAIGETCLDNPVVESTDEGTVVWTSPDGVSWTRVAEPAGLDETYWLESVGTQLVAMGYEPTDGPSSIVTVFVSEDGVDWTQVFREELGDEFADFDVVGRRGSELIRVQGARGSGSMTVWSSSDGTTWTRSSADIADVGRLRSVAGVGSWWVAAGLTTEDVPAVWTSQDGSLWTRVPDDGSIFGSGGGIVDLVEHGSNLVAVGMVIDDTGERPTAWIASP